MPTTKRRRGRPRKGETASSFASSPIPTLPSTTASSLTPDQLSQITAEYFSTPQLLSYNPWHSIAGKKNQGHGSYNPEVKILHFNGLTKRYKAKFQAALDFAFTESFAPDTQETSLYHYNQLAPVGSKIPDCTLTAIDGASYHVQLPLNSSFDLGLNSKPPLQMSPDLALQFPDGASMRRGFAVNCGGLPIASTWLDKPLSGKNAHYFFVSVISTDLPGPSGLSSTKLDRLSITSFSTYTAGLIIYRFDNLGKSLSPCRHILLDHGAIIELKWLPSSDINFSLLACVFSDGTAAVIKVTDSFLSGPDLYSKLVSSSVQLSLDSESLKILCCTWTSHKTLLVGTTEGCVAEFDITNPSKPLFILPLCVPSVLSMQSDYGTGIFGPEPAPDRSNNILLSSGDLDVLLLDLSNPSQLIEGAKFREPLSNIVYSALINGFIYADGTRSLKFSTVRDSSTNVKLKVYDEAPQCCSCSDYSPLVLAGCANGSVRILNVYQHLGQPLKSSNAGSLRLYKLDVLDSDTEQYRLNLGYSVSKKEELTNEYSAYENAIGVTSCSMCNSPESHNVIGCTYGGGLIVVEVLQSVVQG